MLQWALGRRAFVRAASAAVKAALGEGRGQGPRTAPCRGERDIVLVPCWRRPEMLWHCLDNLCRAEGIEAVHVVFRPDHGFDPDTLAVIHAFADRLTSFEVQPAPLCPYHRTKLSANILLGYLSAAARTRRYVYLVEEDIMVARDFLHWHQAVHAQRAELFCSIAVHNHNRDVLAPPDPQGYYLSHLDYCSWGVCFDARVIREWLAPHVRAGYFAHPKRYLRRHFAGSRVGLGYVEQASLIRRLQECSGLPIAYPGVPRAFHAGFYGRNRAGGVSGALIERVLQLQQVIYDHSAMRRVALCDAYAADSEPVSLELNVAGRGRLKELAV